MIGSVQRGMGDRPLVTWKFGASLDGRIAAADGSSRWITSEESRADAHRLRAESDAVVVGSGTQRIDDPQLTVRGTRVSRQPLRVVVDSNARTAADRTAATTGAATTTAEDRKANGYWYPDHAVYNATKDQLMAMPQFKY